jgi:ketosteroid isomerase-like protein
VPTPPTAAELADRVGAALEAGDLTEIADLLDPNVRWGAPDDPMPSCQSRDQVLTWYQHAQGAGGEARVTEVTVHGPKLLVGLRVVAGPPVERHGGPVERWQVITVADGRVVDIRAFDDRGDAATAAASDEVDRA